MDEPETVSVDAPDEAVTEAPAAPTATAPQQPRNWTPVMLGLVVVLLGIVIALQAIQLLRSDDVERQVAALQVDVTDLKPLRRDVDIISEQLATLDDQVAAALDAGSSPAAISTQAGDGNLPDYESSDNDTAVVGAMELPDISGPEYYSGQEVDFPAGSNGKARVWLIWAHWCPHCQNELPDLNSWWPENASRFPDIELVTVTSAIDDTRGNPLEAYLDSSQFSFPVIVDESGAVSAKFGTTAFPFWVVTDTEGRVVFRIAGELGIDNVDQIFAQLETMSTES
jgi:thiol-disulfide isomerase/thioredoxin